jgi:predicted anti-sigma-YlaC factor YlaD
MNRVTCQDVVELVTAYLEDTMTAEDRAAFEDHLRICDGCVRYLRQIERTIELVGEVHEESLSPRTRQDLLDAFADWKRFGT